MKLRINFDPSDRDPDIVEEWINVDVTGPAVWVLRLEQRDGYDIPLVEWDAICGPNREYGLKTGDILLRDRAVHYRRPEQTEVMREEKKPAKKKPARRKQAKKQKKSQAKERKQ